MGSSLSRCAGWWVGDDDLFVYSRRILQEADRCLFEAFHLFVEFLKLQNRSQRYQHQQDLFTCRRESPDATPCALSGVVFLRSSRLSLIIPVRVTRPGYLFSVSTWTSPPLTLSRESTQVQHYLANTFHSAVLAPGDDGRVATHQDLCTLRLPRQCL